MYPEKDPDQEQTKGLYCISILYFCFKLVSNAIFFSNSTVSTWNYEKFRQATADRKYMVQTLATVLMTYVQRPSLQRCGSVAKEHLQKNTRF